MQNGARMGEALRTAASIRAAEAQKSGPQASTKLSMVLFFFILFRVVWKVLNTVTIYVQFTIRSFFLSNWPRVPAFSASKAH